MPTAAAFASVPPFPEDVPVYELPRLSLAKLISNDAAQSKELFETFRIHGFALLDMNTCPEGEALLKEAEDMFDVTRQVTIGLPVEEKMKYVPTPPVIFGYSSVGKTKTESGLPDRFESYSVSSDDMFGNVPAGPNPKPVEENRAAIKSYIGNAFHVGELIMNQLDEHLRLPKGTLASLQRLDRESGSTLRMLRYPPQPEGDRRTAFLGHTDIGTITILFNVLGGLQILPPGMEATEENWRYVKPEPGCAIINLGDAMVEWSGGILRSNLHRVFFAPGEQATQERYSLAYAIRPEGVISMNRLAIEGSAIRTAEEDGEVDLNCDANQWLARKSKGIREGKDTARSRGGRELKVY
jgi:isopenicillin N synthase-like dioxygenase